MPGGPLRDPGHPSGSYYNNVDEPAKEEAETPAVSELSPTNESEEPERENDEK